MGKPLYEKVARDVFPKTRTLYLSCYAEPFCSKNIIEFISIAKIKYKVPFVSLTTNGMLITSSIAKELVMSGINEIVFSISGGEKETYEYCQSGASWEALWKNIGIIARIKRECKRSRPELSVNYILNRKSISEVNNIAPLLLQNGIRSVNLRELIPFRCMNKDFYNEYRLHVSDLQLIEVACTQFKNHGIKVVNSYQCDSRRKLPISEKYPCLFPFVLFFISSDARVKFCIFKDWEYSLENNSLKDIMKTESYLNLIKNLKNKSTAECLTSCPMFNGNDGSPM